MFRWVEDLHYAVSADRLWDLRGLAPALDTQILRHLRIVDAAKSAEMVVELHARGAPLFLDSDASTLLYALWFKKIPVARGILGIIEHEHPALSPQESEAQHMLQLDDKTIEQIVSGDPAGADLLHGTFPLLESWRAGFARDWTEADLRKGDLLRAIALRGDVPQLHAFCRAHMQKVQWADSEYLWRASGVRQFFFFGEESTEVFAVLLGAGASTAEMHVLSLMNPNAEIPQKLDPRPSYMLVGGGRDIPRLIVAVMIRDYKGMNSELDSGADVNTVFRGQTALSLAVQLAISPFTIARMLAAGGVMDPPLAQCRARSRSASSIRGE